MSLSESVEIQGIFKLVPVTKFISRQELTKSPFSTELLTKCLMHLQIGDGPILKSFTENDYHLNL